MKIKKIICIVTVSCVFSTGILSATKPKVVHATELTPITSKVDMSKTTQNNKAESVGSAIEEIEQKFLRQNVDGTFYILSEAYNVVDSTTIDFIKSNMEEVNTLIRSKTLEFKISDTNGEAEVEVVKDNSDTTPQRRVKRSSSSVGKILSNYTYCSNYKWFWWGYKTRLNKDGCQLLQNELELEALIVGSGTTACGFIPIVGAAAAAAALVGEAIVYGSAIKECQNGQVTGKADVIGMGKPSSGKIWDVTAVY